MNGVYEIFTQDVLDYTMGTNPIPKQNGFTTCRNQRDDTRALRQNSVSSRLGCDYSLDIIVLTLRVFARENYCVCTHIHIAIFLHVIFFLQLDI